MTATILLDHDVEGEINRLIAALAETGWDRLLTIEFKRLRDYSLPDNYPDRDIWRFVQESQIWLFTNNRNRDDDTSLQATIERENTDDCLPVITVSDKERLKEPDYRQRVAYALVELILSPEKYRGTGRCFVP